MEPDAAARSVGERGLDPARHQTLVELVDEPREQGRAEPPEQACAGGEAASAIDEVGPA